MFSFLWLTRGDKRRLEDDIIGTLEAIDDLKYSLKRLEGLNDLVARSEVKEWKCLEIEMKNLRSLAISVSNRAEIELHKRGWLEKDYVYKRLRKELVIVKRVRVGYLSAIVSEVWLMDKCNESIRFYNNKVSNKYKVGGVPQGWIDFMKWE